MKIKYNGQRKQKRTYEKKMKRFLRFVLQMVPK